MVWIVLKNKERLYFNGLQALVEFRHFNGELEPNYIAEQIQNAFYQLQEVMDLCNTTGIPFNDYVADRELSELMHAHNKNVNRIIYQHKDLYSKYIKEQLIKKRREEFDGKRASLKLALIERDGYKCAGEGCEELDDLTIDHIVPLSKGGTDDLENLKFLCRSHNSRKSDTNGEPTA